MSETLSQAQQEANFINKEQEALCVRIFLHLQYLEGTLSLISLIFHHALSFRCSCSLLLTEQPKHTNKTIGKICQKSVYNLDKSSGFL